MTKKEYTVNKICTSFDQSKRLIELGIDIDTADLTVTNLPLNGGERFDFICMRLPSDTFPSITDGKSEKIPAWSLNALLELMPIETHLYKMQDEDDYTKHYYKVGSCDRKGWIELNDTLAIDAAFKMVVWLKENNAL